MRRKKKILIKVKVEIVGVEEGDAVTYSVLDHVHVALEMREACLVGAQETAVQGERGHTRAELERGRLLGLVWEQNDHAALSQLELIVDVHVRFANHTPQPRAKHSDLVGHVEGAADSFAVVEHDEYVAVLVHLELGARFGRVDPVLRVHFL